MAGLGQHLAGDLAKQRIVVDTSTCAIAPLSPQNRKPLNMAGARRLTNRAALLRPPLA